MKTPQGIPRGFAQTYFGPASAGAAQSAVSATQTTSTATALSQISLQAGIISWMSARSELNGSAIEALLVDEDAMLRHAVRELLEPAGIRIAGEASTADQAIVKTLELEPDVVVMAVGLRGVSGIEATRRIREAVPNALVLILSKSTEAAKADAAIRAGAAGFVLKDDPPDEIVAAVRAVADGEAPLSPRVAGELLGQIQTEPADERRSPELTERECMVLELLADGHRNGEIADLLSISVYTVKRHVSHLLSKLKVENRTQAAVEATRRDLL